MASSAQHVFCTLPNELFLLILDALVGNRSTRDTHTDNQPIALPPTHAGAKALLSLCLVSRSIFPLASQYLYTHCVHLSSPSRFALFTRTVLLDRRQDVQSGESVPRFALLRQSDALLCASAAYLFPAHDKQRGEQRRNDAPPVLFEHIVNVCHILGRTLKRLVLNLSDVSPPSSSSLSSSSFGGTRFDAPWDRSGEPVFASMVLLQDLVLSANATTRLSSPPASLRRLCIVNMHSRDISLSDMSFAFASPALEMLVLKRPEKLSGTKIETLFTTYSGLSLDVVLVDVLWNHGAPWGTRPWSADDRVRIWEADVPTSFYGDDYDGELCEEWIWRHALWGTLWGTEKRRMEERIAIDMSVFEGLY